MHTVMHLLSLLLHYLQHQPFIALFLVMGAGYALGQVNVKGIGLGATGASLVVGLTISVLAASRGVNFQIPEFASTIFFNLFMFAIGMKVGPQFLLGLRRDAGKFIAIAIFIPLVSGALCWAARAIWHLPPGLSAGIFAGANTATPGLGAAQSAYTTGSMAAAARDVAMGNLSTAFAFSYCISMALFILLIKVMPVLWHRDLRAAGRDFIASTGGAGGDPLPGAAQEFLTGSLPVATRAYKVKEQSLFGMPLGKLRQAYPLIAIERVLRGKQVLAPDDGLVLQAGDDIALFGRIPRLLVAGPRIGPEVDAPEIRDGARSTVEVVVRDSRQVGRKLRDVAVDVGHGFFLNAMFRGGVEIPITLDTEVRRGDVLRVTASEARVKHLEGQVGPVVRSSLTTDLVTLALALTIGAALGSIVIPLGAIKLTLGSSVGLLLVGIALSTLRTYNPALGGPFPEPARQLIEDLGLNVFIAILGLNAGAGVTHAVSIGALVPIVVGCLVMGLVPGVLAWALGLTALKMNGALLIGAVAGGRCNGAGMRAAQEVSDSTVPAISYPVTFAISNVLCTLLAYVIALTG